jgi:hypothetical protein
MKQPGYSFQETDSHPIDEYGNPIQVTPQDQSEPAPKPLTGLSAAIAKRRAQRRGR